MSALLKQVKLKNPQFLSVLARLANRFGLVTPIRVAEEAARDIRRSMRKNLEERYSSFESSEERKPNNNDNSEQDGPSRVAVKRNSLLSVDISLFKPRAQRNMDNVNSTAVEQEIERMQAQHAELNVAAAYEDAGKAMQDFETRDIQTFEELKTQLETYYQTKQSTTHLQIEFNSLKQKSNETAHAFGQHLSNEIVRIDDGRGGTTSFIQASNLENN
ncbi:hypothetical protein EAG_09127 [Camponotus floridanus]|uniref:Uncharacterized protein n=1 Tax=Camponotus floridanus TaxID=104421 RepID=E2ANW1_CAMFO|nr:hypothetical protein EAG_09127 [Camponotus floridanus]